jgi:hypothetical protein
MNSVTGTWGNEVLSEKVGNPNAAKLAEAEITANRLGFVKLNFSENEKPKSTYKREYSVEQLGQVKELEKKNMYSRYVRLK